MSMSSLRSNQQASSEKKFRIGVVDVSDLKKKRARDISRKELDIAKGELGRFSLKKIWKYNLARPYYENKARIEAEQRIEREGTAFTDAEGSSDDEKKALHQEAVGAIVDRFTRGKDKSDNRLIRDSIGEEKTALGDAAAEQEIKRLALKYGTTVPFDSAAQVNFSRESDALLKKYGFGGADNVDYANNLLEVVHQIQQAVTEGMAKEQLEKDIEIIVGKAKAGIESRVNLDAFERIVEKCRSTRLGAVLVNEGTVALAVASTLYVAGVRLGRGVLNSKVAAVLSFGGTALAGAGLAAKTEATHMKKDRAQHMEQRARGGKIDPNNEKRRQEMEKTMYKTKSATVLVSEICSSLYEVDAKGNPMLGSDGARVLKGGLSRSDIDVSLRAIADAEERSRYTDDGNIFIDYSGEASLERERTCLLTTCNDARDDIQVWLEKNPSSMRGVSAGVARTSEQYVIDEVTRLAGDARAVLDAEMTTKDRIFEKMKKKSAMKAGGIGFGVGLLFGAAAQEAWAAASDGQVGIVDMLRDHHVSGESSRTFLAYLFGSENVPISPTLGTHDFTAFSGHTYTLPNGVDFVPAAGGVFNLVRGGSEVLVPGLTFEPNGNLTASAKALLSSHGIMLPPDTVVHGPSTPGAPISAKDYLHTHPNAVDVEHGKYYDNDTRLHRDAHGKLVGADRNELRFDFAEKGPHKTADGVIEFTVERMYQGGSKHAGDIAGVKPFENLKAYLFPAEDGDPGDVGKAFEIPVGNDGRVNVDLNAHPELRPYFNENGYPKKGWNLQVDEVHDPKTPGDPPIIESLATITGRGKAVEDIITEVPGKDTITTTISIPSKGVGEDLPGIIPPPMAVVGRNPLEKLKYPKEKVSPREDVELDAPLITEDYPPIIGGGDPDFTDGPYYGVFNIKRGDYQKRMCDRLKKNPDANLNERLEIKEYIARQSHEHLREIESLKRESGPMNPDCKLSVCIPVAGHQEGKVIYATLENYLNQTANPKEFEIVLFINHPDKDRNGNEVVPDETMREVRRFQSEHPELNVVVMSKVIPLDRAKIGYVRKLLSDTVLLRNLERGESAPDLIMVSNDADNKGVAPEYIQNFLDKFGERRDTDAFMGQLDWDLLSYSRNPLVHVGTRLFQYVDVQLRRRDKNNIASSGANFAYRAGMYAAVNGYTDHSELAEDVDLGRAIKASRMGSKNRIGIGFAGARVSRIFTSARRAEMAVKDGLSPVEQWEKGFSAFDDEVRKFDWEALVNNINYENSSDVNKLVERVEYIVNRSMRAMTWVRGDKRVFERALGWLGITFEWDGDNQISITNADRLIQSLKKYKEEGSKILERKTGVKRSSQKSEEDNLERDVPKEQVIDRAPKQAENRRAGVPEKWVNRINLDNFEKYNRRGARKGGRDRQERLRQRMVDEISRSSRALLARVASGEGRAITADDLLVQGGLGSRSIVAPDLDSNPETAGLYRGILQLRENFEVGFRNLRISDRQIERVMRPFEDETVRAYVERLSAQLIMAKDGYDQKRKKGKA